MRIFSNPLCRLNAVSTLSTPDHLQPIGLNTTSNEPLTQLINTTGRGRLVPITGFTRVIQRTAPEDLTQNTSTGPGDAVEGDLVDHLAPDGDFGAENVLGLLVGESGDGVVRVDALPALIGIAPVGEWLGLLVSGSGIVGEPLAFAAVEVLDTVSRVCGYVTAVYCG